MARRRAWHASDISRPVAYLHLIEFGRWKSTGNSTDSIVPAAEGLGKRRLIVAGLGGKMLSPNVFQVSRLRRDCAVLPGPVIPSHTIRASRLPKPFQDLDIHPNECVLRNTSEEVSAKRLRRRTLVVVQTN